MGKSPKYSKEITTFSKIKNLPKKRNNNAENEFNL